MSLDNQTIMEDKDKQNGQTVTVLLKPTSVPFHCANCSNLVSANDFNFNVTELLTFDKDNFSWIPISIGDVISRVYNIINYNPSEDECLQLCTVCGNYLGELYKLYQGFSELRNIESRISQLLGGTGSYKFGVDKKNTSNNKTRKLRSRKRKIRISPDRDPLNNDTPNKKECQFVPLEGELKESTPLSDSPVARNLRPRSGSSGKVLLQSPPPQIRRTICDSDSHPKEPKRSRSFEKRQKVKAENDEVEVKDESDFIFDDNQESNESVDNKTPTPSASSIADAEEVKEEPQFLLEDPEKTVQTLSVIAPEPNESDSESEIESSDEVADDNDKDTDFSPDVDDSSSTSESEDTPKYEPEREPCSICGKVMYKCHIKNHMDAVHHKLKPYGCPTCGKSFAAANTHKLHLETHDPNSDLYKKKFLCNICGKEFRSKGGLKQHLDIHAGAPRKESKEFKCDICHKTLRSNDLLNRHKLVHAGIRAFICEICGKSFTEMKGLRRHSVFHLPENEKPHKCPFPDCGRRFPINTGLKEHLVSSAHNLTLEEAREKAGIRGNTTVERISHSQD